MKALKIAFAVTLLAVPAAADCIAEVKSLFVGGPIAPFARGPWHEVTMIVAEDGTETLSADSEWETPSRVKTITPTSHIIAIGSETWMSNTKGESWDYVGATLPDDIEAFHKAHNAALMRNMTDVFCEGTVELDGQMMNKYIYRTKTDPNEFDSWFGGLYTAFIDVENNQLKRLEIRESIASWAPEPAKTTSITVLDYDIGIKVNPPE